MGFSTLALVSASPDRANNRVHIGPADFDLPDAALQGFRPSTRRYSAGNTIVQEGDEFASVIIVCDGWLSITKSLENGEAQLIDFVLPGDFVDPTTADGLTAGSNIEAITDVTVLILPSTVWRSMLHNVPHLENVIEHMQAAERARFSEHILRLGKGSAQNRIAYALLEFCVRVCARDQPNGQTFHVPLTQSHIGEFTGLSSVHVCRTMRRFVRNGIIETSGHMDIRIIDLGALSDIAGIEAEHLAREITPILD